ncbi:proteasome subunit alpha type-6, partial [Tanacetum coccineum]
QTLTSFWNWEDQHGRKLALKVFMTLTNSDADGCRMRSNKATSVGLKEQEAINFLEKKIKNDPEFSYDETTAISSLQSVLQEDFKANEIEKSSFSMVYKNFQVSPAFYSLQFEGEGWQFEGEGKCVKIPQDLDGINIYDILEPCYHGDSSSKIRLGKSESNLPESFRRLGETERLLPV